MAQTASQESKRFCCFQAGQVMRVMKFAERWASSADPSLVRHLIFTLLGACAPPYSSDFAASLLRQGFCQMRCLCSLSH